MDSSTPRYPVGLLGVWSVTRLLLLLFVFKVFVFPGPDVTTDVSVIYQGWYEVLRTGTFPLDDVTWQYPPAAALAILSPGLLPFLPYANAFFVLAFLADSVVFLMLLSAGMRRGNSPRGTWMWVLGVPLLGPTVYSRYDVMVTAVAVGALLAGMRSPKVMGALAGFGALVKVWPVLLLTGVRGVRSWAWAGVTAAATALVFAVTMPGAFAFLTFQRDRGTEVESLGSLVFHVARHFGWSGQVAFNYGSVEFVGPYVPAVSRAALILTLLAFGWLALWRLRVRDLTPRATADAAFVAVLMFTVTSRVISPQYLVWLVGLAAVCLVFSGSVMTWPSGMVLAACLLTVLEFPVHFANVVASDGIGMTLLFLRNGLLLAATITAAARLWRSTIPETEKTSPPPAQTVPDTITSP